VFDDAAGVFETTAEARMRLMRKAAP
jgi:hypothetical protein